MADKKIELTNHAIERIRQRWHPDVDYVKGLMINAIEIFHLRNASFKYFMYDNYYIVAKDLKKKYRVITIMNI